jgi:large subunit ribosomal protein L29
MKSTEFREKTREELEELYDDRRQELYNLYSQRSMSQLEKPHRVREIKRDIARILTILKDGKYSHK